MCYSFLSFLSFFFLFSHFLLLLFSFLFHHIVSRFLITSFARLFVFMLYFCCFLLRFKCVDPNDFRHTFSCNSCFRFLFFFLLFYISLHYILSLVRYFYFILIDVVVVGMQREKRRKDNRESIFSVMCFFNCITHQTQNTILKWFSFFIFSTNWCLKAKQQKWEEKIIEM